MTKRKMNNQRGGGAIFNGSKWIGDPRTKDYESKKAAASEAEVLNMAMGFSEKSRQEILDNIIQSGRHRRVYVYNWKNAGGLISAIERYSKEDTDPTDAYKLDHLMESIVRELKVAEAARKAASARYAASFLLDDAQKKVLAYGKRLADGETLSADHKAEHDLLLERGKASMPPPPALQMEEVMTTLPI